MTHHDIKLPKIGLTFSRAIMPQLGKTEDFLKQLDRHGIKYSHEKIHPKNLKASQSEFNYDAIRSLMTNPKKARSSVVISSDNHVVDGHHHFVASYNLDQEQKVIRVHLPILDLINLVKKFPTTTYKTVDDVKSVRGILESIKTSVREKIKNTKY